VTPPSADLSQPSRRMKPFCDFNVIS
jgi:hypothetical protein